MAKAMNIERLYQNGYIRAKVMPNGEVAAVSQMLFTGALCVGCDEEGFYRTRYCYETVGEAMTALSHWEGEGDPPGKWIKQKPENRINPEWANDEGEVLGKE